MYKKGGKEMLKWINNKKNRKGFTLVELVIVVAILGILSSIAVPRFNISKDKAKWSAHLTNIRVIEGAIAMYEVDGGVIDESFDEKKLMNEYISTWPISPGKYKFNSEGKFTPNPSIEETEKNVNVDKPVNFKLEGAD